MTDFRYENPVPVFSDDKLVGFAYMYRMGQSLYADVAVDYSIPARLSVETGEKHYLLPYTRMHKYKIVSEMDAPEKKRMVPTIGNIERLEIRKDCDDPQSRVAIGAEL